MLENLTDITIGEVLGTAHRMHFSGYRFITATCVDNADGTMDIIYHYDKEYQLKQFRLNIGINDELPSISKIYFCAILVENEIKELFGVNIAGIVVDYGGHMLLSDGAPTSPQACGGQITIVQKDGKE